METLQQKNGPAYMRVVHDGSCRLEILFLHCMLNRMLFLWTLIQKAKKNGNDPMDHLEMNLPEIGGHGFGSIFFIFWKGMF